METFSECTNSTYMGNFQTINHALGFSSFSLITALLQHECASPQG